MAKKRTTKKTSSAKTPTADHRIVILHGPESMLRQEYFRELKAALAKEHGDLEPRSFDGDNAQLSEVMDELRTVGMFQSHNLVVVDQADKFVSDHREALERYANDPEPHATLVMRAEKWMSPGRFEKAVDKVGLRIKCEPPKPAEAQQWLTQRAQEQYKTKLTSRVAGLFVQRLGCDLGRLDGELAKVVAATGEGGTIDEKVLDDLVGQGSDEKAWAIQSAVLEAVGSGGKRKQATGRAIAKLHEVVDVSGESDVLVSFAVADMMRRVFLGVMMKKQGAPAGQIMKSLRIFGDATRPFMNLIDKLPPRDAKRLFDLSVNVDRRAKSGLGNLMHNLEGFCAVLADAVDG